MEVGVGHDRVWHIWPVHLAARTSPVYVTTEEPPDLPPGDAAYLLTLLDGGLTWLDPFSIPANPVRQQIRCSFENAKAALHAR